MTKNKHGAGAYDELDVWYADRDYLTSHGFIQRSQYIARPCIVVYCVTSLRTGLSREVSTLLSSHYCGPDLV